MPVNSNFRSTSRENVHVVLRANMSISPDASAVKRVLPVVGTNSTAFGSPKTAAATARHTPTSKPCHSPFASGAANPTRPVVTPQFNLPRAFTSSIVPATAADAARPATVNAPKITDFFIFTSSWFCSIQTNSLSGTPKLTTLVDHHRLVHQFVQIL